MFTYLKISWGGRFQECVDRDGDRLKLYYKGTPIRVYIFFNHSVSEK